MTYLKCIKCRRPIIKQHVKCHCGHDYPPLENDWRKLLIDHLNRGHLPLRAWMLNVLVIGKDAFSGRTCKVATGLKKGTLDIGGVVAPTGLYFEFDLKVFHVVTPDQEARMTFLRSAGAVTFIQEYDVERTLRENVELAEVALMKAVGERMARP